jgi:hypothetical protein
MKDSKPNKKSNKKEKIKTPDPIGDAIWAVNDYEDVRLKRREINNETVESLHKKAVRLITICNNACGNGTISISKARCLNAIMYRETKIKGIMETLKCERPEALDAIAKKKAA